MIDLLFSDNEQTDYYSCFISYAHKDKAFARKLYDALQNRGIRCWLDEHNIFPGDDIRDEIDRGIKAWDKVLLCCSKNSLSSYWVDKEIERALRKEERRWKESGKRILTIIPLILDNFLFTEWKSSRSDEIRNRLAADFRGWDADKSIFNMQLDSIIKALHADEKSREKPPKSKL